MTEKFVWGFAAPKPPMFHGYLSLADDFAVTESLKRGLRHPLWKQSCKHTSTLTRPTPVLVDFSLGLPRTP